MKLTGAPGWEIGVGVFLVIACGVVLWETRDLAPGTFEPLGSAPVPQATAVLIALLSVAVIVGAVRRLRSDDGVPAPPVEGQRTVDAWSVAAATVAYVLALDARILDFAPLTALFLFVVIGWLVRFRPRPLAAAAVVAVVTGWGCAFVFTRIFVVDLPGL